MTSTSIPRVSKSFRQRSSVMYGWSVPNSALVFSWRPMARTNCGGKYFGDQPDKSR